MKPPEQAPTKEALAADLAELRAELLPFELDLDTEFDRRTQAYAQELLLWNKRHNLLSRRDESNIVSRHVSASLGVLLLEPAREGRWIDVGTGAGFPGMVIKISKPQLDISLMDSLSKRCEFLTAMREALRLPDITVLNCRAEDHIEKSGKSSYDVVTCKAVSSLARSLPAFSPLLRPGGRFVTFKGPRWTEEMDEADQQGELRRSNLRFVSALRVPWTQTHVISLARR